MRVLFMNEQNELDQLMTNQKGTCCSISSACESFLFNNVWLVSFDSKPLLVDVVTNNYTSMLVKSMLLLTFLGVINTERKIAGQRLETR